MKPHIDAGKLVMLGLIQEQHADRCQLFKQWKQLDFPVAQDALNTNGIAVVPVYVAIDEHGVVRGRPRSPRSFDQEFLDRKFDPPSQAATQLTMDVMDPQAQQPAGAESGSIDQLIRAGDAGVLWQHSSSAVKQSIKHYRQALQRDPQRSDVLFRLGVANRLLYELGNQSDASLFKQSVSDWESALKLNPNQYIYRRRIEQYGPRLKKPYSFYDWVAQAREELADRGEKPIPLAVEPNGAELAKRARMMEVDDSAVNPDPDGAITEDSGQWVRVHANTVPTSPQPGDVVAVHVGFKVTGQAKWNHETTPLQVWIEQPAAESIKLSSQLIVDQTPYRTADSTQPVSISFEVQVPETQQQSFELKGFALFNICETQNGQCVYRRREFSVQVPVRNRSEAR